MTKPYYKDGRRWIVDRNWLNIQIQSGKTIKEIAEEIGCSVNVVRKFVSKKQKENTNQSTCKDIEIPENENEILELLQKIDERVLDFRFIENKPVILLPDSEAILNIHQNGTLDIIIQKLQKQYNSIIFLNAKHTNIQAWYQNIKKERRFEEIRNQGR